MKYVELPRIGGALQEELPAEALRALCHRAFGPAGVAAAWELLRSGRFNTTYRITLADGRPVILRLAPPASARLFSHERWLLRRECGVHGVLAGAVAQVPRLLFQDFSGALVPRDYVFLEYLPGRLWDEVRADLTPGEDEALWRQLGGLVGAIHRIGGAAYGPPAPLGGCPRWSQAVLADIEGLIGDIEILGLDGALPRRFLRLVSGTAPVLDRCGPPRLLHGDLWPKNILVARVDGTPVITGLLDGERACWGDPVAEWIFGFLDIPPAFWTAYGRDLSEPALDPAARIRRLVYNGRGALQLMLEAWRWQLDDTFARRLLTATAEGLDAALPSRPGLQVPGIPGRPQGISADPMQMRTVRSVPWR